MIGVGIIWILVISYTAADHVNDTLPTFEWGRSDPLENGTVQLIIDFHDEGEREFVNLTRIDSEFGSDEMDDEEDECLFEGYLQTEHDVPVTVDGCPGNDTFQVIFNSKRIPDSTFKINKGVVTAFHMDKHQMSGFDDDENVVILDDRDLPDFVSNIGDREISERSLPSRFKVTLSLSYDNLFLNNVCGGRHSTAKRRVEKIIKLAQGYYLDRPTLGTAITLDVKEIKHTNNELKLRNSGVRCNSGCTLRRAGNDIASQNPIDVDNYHFISADNPGPGVWDTAGIARSVGYQGWAVMGSVCMPEKKDRVGITEFWGDPNNWDDGKLNAALTFAHELGHSLGMPHDFSGSNIDNPRGDSTGRSCLKVDGIMSYKSKRSTWSKCSKEAISGWFKQLTGINKNCKANGGNTAASVSCGNHRAKNCASCTQGNGWRWCNGDCQWDWYSYTCKLG